MNIPSRPLGLVTEMVEEAGLRVTYAYDDLVFVEHNPFLIRFTDSGNVIQLYFNKNCDPDQAVILEGKLKYSANARGVVVNRMDEVYEIVPREDSEEMDIQFYQGDYS